MAVPAASGIEQRGLTAGAAVATMARVREAREVLSMAGKQNRQDGLQRLEATFVGGAGGAPTVNDDGSIGLLLYTGTPVDRMSWDTGAPYKLQLSTAQGAVDTTRLDSGTCPLLDGHEADESEYVIGRLVEGSLEYTPDGIRCRALLSTDPAKAGIVGDIRAGILRAVSVGARALVRSVTEATATAPKTETWDRWELCEASIVAMPADPRAQTFALADTPPAAEEAPAGDMECEGEGCPGCESPDCVTTRKAKCADAPAEPPAAEAKAAASDVVRLAVEADRARVTALLSQAQKLGLDPRGPAVQKLIADGIDVATAAASMIETLAVADRAAGITGAHRGGLMSYGQTGAEKLQAVMGEAFAAAAHAPARQNLEREAKGGNEDARKALQLSRGNDILLTYARYRQELGESIDLANRQGLVKLAQSSSDFPVLLGGSIGVAVAQYRSTLPQAWKQVLKPVQFNGLHTRKPVILSGPGGFSVIPEGDTYTAGSMAEQALSYDPVKRGKILQLTEKAVYTNQAQELVDAAIRGFATAAERSIGEQFAALLALNSGEGPTMGYDSEHLFSAAHANKASNAAIDPSKIDELIQKLNAQTDASGQQLYLQGRYLLHGVGIAGKVSQLYNPNWVATQASNTMSGLALALTPVVCPYIASTTGFWALTDPMDAPVFELASPSDLPSVRVDMRFDFHSDCWEIKANSYDTVQAVDHRGAAVNLGA